MSKIKRSAILISVLMAAAFRVPAQYADSTSNLVSYADKILIKVNLSSQLDRFRLKEKTGNGLSLRANNGYKTFVSLDYEFIGFSYGFSPKILRANNDDDLKGKSSFTNYRFLVFLKKWLQTIEYNKIRGYYAENTMDFIAGWKKDVDPYIQLPNLKIVTWSMSTAYIANPDFSFKNIVYQTEWQKRSAGSFVPTLFYDYTRSSFDEGGISGLQKDFNIRLGLGYYYTAIIDKRFYVSPYLMPSLGFRFSRYESVAQNIPQTERATYMTRFVEGGLKAGFNTKRVVIGAGLNFNVSWYNEEQRNVVETDHIFGILYFGYRFHAPKILSNAYTKVNSMLPF